MTADERGVCGVDIVVSNEVGESSRVEMLVSDDDVVVFAEDPLLVRVANCLSMAVDEVLCGAGVAWSGRRCAGPSVVVEPEVAPPGGVAGSSVQSAP